MFLKESQRALQLFIFFHALKFSLVLEVHLLHQDSNATNDNKLNIDKSTVSYEVSIRTHKYTL